ncbi:MAG: metallophosphoesterase family protein [Chloroflexota bacterium]
MVSDIILGVVADTHIPDRASRLSENLLQALDAQTVEYILHAGDISNRRIIDQLSEIAPVYAVQGNRDWFYKLKLPTHIDLTFNGVKLTLTHGHGNIPYYIYDKMQYLLLGYTLTRYQRNLAKHHPAAQVIVFGHTHNQVNVQVNGQRFFNPGAAYPCEFNDSKPQYGILHISPRGEITGKLLSSN